MKKLLCSFMFASLAMFAFSQVKTGNENSNAAKVPQPAKSVQAKPAAEHPATDKGNQTPQNVQPKRTSEPVDASKVPQAVKDTQEKNFKGLAVTKWVHNSITAKEQTNDRYVASFKKDNLNYKARYNKDGTALNYTVFYAKEKLPEAVTKTLKTNYPDYEIKSGALIHSYKLNKDNYRVRLTKESTKLIVYLDATGNELKGKNIPEDTKEGEEDND